MQQLHTSIACRWSDHHPASANRSLVPRPRPFPPEVAVAPLSRGTPAVRHNTGSQQPGWTDTVPLSIHPTPQWAPPDVREVNRTSEADSRAHNLDVSNSKGLNLTESRTDGRLSLVAMSRSETGTQPQAAKK